MNRIALALAAVLSTLGCVSDPATEAPGAKTRIAVASAGGLSVELLSDRDLETGMTPIYLEVTSGGQAVTDADVTFEPMMAMSGGSSHACPVGKPAPGSDGLYHGYVSFGMASSMMGSWSAVVGVTRPGAARVDVAFPALAVSDSGRARSFQDFDPETLVTTRYLASIRFLSAPAVGLNPIVVTLHRMAGMTSFPPVDDAAVHVDPQMPSMAHGSSGNVDPVLVTSGVYQGTLGFSMMGAWETTVTFSRPAGGGGTRAIGAPKFTTTF